MARLEDLHPVLAAAAQTLPCPQFADRPWVAGPPLSERRVVIVTTAGLHCRGDRPYTLDAADYRIIPGDTPAGNLVMSHVSVNFDRTGFQQDLNVVFPIDRLGELAAEGTIGSVAAFHYSFMGATHPDAMAPMARHLAGLLKQDRVNAVLLSPV